MIKKAVISTGGKQYLVSEGDTVKIELTKDSKALSFEPLLVINDDKISIGNPLVSGSKVTAEVITPNLKADKVIAITYKAKKRVHVVQGHRQTHTEIKIKNIT